MKTILSLAATIISLSGCKDLDRDALWLVMSVDKAAVAMDDSVRVQLTITNTSDSDVLVYPASAYSTCLPGFEVVDAQGRRVIMQAACLAMFPSRVPLGPGEQLDVTTWWYPGISRVNGNPIAPGAFAINAAVHGDDSIVRTRAAEVQVTE